MKATETRYWLWAVVMPVIMFAITYLVLRIAMRSVADGVSGKMFVIAFISSIAATVPSSVLTLLSVKYEERLCRVAVTSCVIYFGVCVTVLFF